MGNVRISGSCCRWARQPDRRDDCRLDNGGSARPLALDAPLGWPAVLGETLGPHIAGESLDGTPNELFRRQTDHFIKAVIGRQPLDVGADRIARTAHAALGLLEQLRQLTGQPVPLAWTPHDPAPVSSH